jgi:translation initiation factor 1A
MSKKGGKKNMPQKEQRALALKGDDTEYGLVTKILGNGRFSVRLNMQNREVIGRLRGKFRKGAAKKANIVSVDSVVLVGIRDFQDNTVDIIHLYDAGEIRQLKKSGEFVEESVRNADNVGQADIPTEDDPFDFDEI